MVNISIIILVNIFATLFITVFDQQYLTLKLMQCLKLLDHKEISQCRTITYLMVFLSPKTASLNTLKLRFIYYLDNLKLELPEYHNYSIKNIKPIADITKWTLG